MSRELWILLLSTLPILERTTIPLGLAKGMTPLAAFGWALSGNLIPVIPLLLILDPAVKLALRFVPALNRPVNIVFERARRKHSDKMERYGALGIAMLVSIPVPGFGPWTGVLLAYLFEVRMAYAVPAIFAGATVACVLLTLASTSVAWLWRVFHGPVAFAISGLFLATIVFVLLKRKR